MSGHQYLESILRQQELRESELQTLRTTRDEIENWLRGDIGVVPRIYYGGSYAKNTLLRLSFDLDIVIYFPATERSTLQDIFWRIQGRLAAKYVVRARTVALRLPYQGGFHIDVVPGRAQDSSYRYATLFKNESQPSTLQTSLKIHIESVKDAGLSDIVRLTKLWRLRQGINVSTFPLEIAVSRAMKGVRRDDLGNSFWTVLQYLANDFQGARLNDPANSNNEIALDSRTRLAVASTARASTAEKTWERIIW